MFDSIVVCIDIDVGLLGFGEVCLFGLVYLFFYVVGVRVGLCELVLSFIGLDFI